MKKEFTKEESKIIEIELNDGTKVNGELLFIYEENGDTYVLYELEEKVYGAKMKEDNSLLPIEDDEWNIIERIYEMWTNENEEGDEE